MIINNIKLKNFQLFEDVDIKLQKLNIIAGRNLDDPEDSSNGSGKTTLGINAITFGLYGTVKDLNLKDLIRDKSKKAIIELDVTHNNKNFYIIRTIPSSLEVFIDNKKLKDYANDTQKQNVLDKEFQNYDFFRQFRTIDKTKGVNLLDSGIITLRKTLMSFIEEIFDNIRKRLLEEKLNREKFNKDKKVIKHSYSEHREEILQNALESLNEERENIIKEVRNIDNRINEIRGNIEGSKKVMKFLDRDLYVMDKYSQCPFCYNKLDEKEKTKVKDLKLQTKTKCEEEIEEYNQQLDPELDFKEYQNNIKINLDKTALKIKELLLKLSEVSKFSEYKYTKEDVLLYQEAIKIVDTFSGVYIQKWLSNLEIIVNNLLKKVALELKFTNDKDFLKIYDEQKEMTYNKLSGGQKTFLSAIFKLAILLQNGLSGIILIDEGIGEIDLINLHKFIDICRDLPFQIILIYQNVDNIENVNIIQIERQKGVSYVK